MKHIIALILDDCLAQMRQGASFEECLRMYSEYADELGSLLHLAVDIKDLPAPEPSGGALSELMIRIGEQSAAETNKRRVLPSFAKNRPFFSRLLGHRKLIWALNGALLFLALLFGATTISANSMPGDVFYPLKLFTDKVVFMLTLNSDRKAELRLTFSEKRFQEMMAGLQHSNALDTGLLKAMLNEAKLALEEIDTSSYEKPQLLTRLDNLNTYQMTVLSQLRPRVDSISQKIVIEAIDMCDARGNWLRSMIKEDQNTSSNNQDTMQTHTPPRQISRQSRNCQWGPGCNW